MMFKLDTHIHTSDVSLCAQVEPEEMVEAYCRAGYSGIVITNHYNYDTLDVIAAGITDPIARAARYLSGYRRAKAAAKGRLQVLLGMEARFPSNYNDYLVFGIDEAFVEEVTVRDIMRLDPFRELVHERGGLVFQAHPFRNGMTVIKPDRLDGIEVYNANVGHDSRNDIARQWAEKFGLLMSSGSDYHALRDVGRGGIMTEQPILDNAQLCEHLRVGVTLIKE